MSQYTGITMQGLKYNSDKNDTELNIYNRRCPSDLCVALIVVQKFLNLVKDYIWINFVQYDDISEL